MSRDVWNDRPITFVEFSIAEGAPVIEAMEQRKWELLSWWLLVLSARYTDTASPVFQSLAEIGALTFRQRIPLMRLANKAGYINGIFPDNPDAPPASNGYDSEVVAFPSH